MLDLFNREVVGWSLKPRVTADLVTSALTMARFRRRPAPGLIQPSAGIASHGARGREVMLALKAAAKGRLDLRQLPPVWHMGDCLDNARASGLFRALATLAGQPIKAMPFAFASPEWRNEKGVGATLGFRKQSIIPRPYN